MKNKKQLEIKKVIIQEEDSYFIFSKMRNDKSWVFFDEYLTKEECEAAMEQTNEAEDIKYMIIKGKLLKYEDAPARFPYYILEG